MNVTQAIYTRSSVRAYRPLAIAREVIESLLRAAVQAPSAMNRQPWLFAVVQDCAALKRYSDQAKQMLLSELETNAKVRSYAPMLRNESFNIFYDAGTLITIGTPSSQPFDEADCWLAAGNLMLAAQEANLATCCIGFALGVLNTKSVKSELGYPPAGHVVAAIVLGAPAIAPPPVPRNEPNIVAWLPAP